MKAMVLNQLGTIAENKSPLELVDMPDPVPRDNEILIKVSTCGVCHTELDEIEGRTPPPQLPVILGHQVVGRVDKGGSALPGYILPAVAVIFAPAALKIYVRALRPPVGTYMAVMPNMRP